MAETNVECVSGYAVSGERHVLHLDLGTLYPAIFVQRSADLPGRPWLRFDVKRNADFEAIDGWHVRAFATRAEAFVGYSNKDVAEGRARRSSGEPRP